MVRLKLILCLALLSACTQKPAPLSTYGGGVGAGSAGMHTVSSGDTVYSISKRYKVDMPDVILANSLSAPFRLYVGQRLKLPAPQIYDVRSGDNLYTVSRLFNVSQSRLAEINSLSAPYTIFAGQKLKIPGLSSTAANTSFPENGAKAAKVEPVRKTVLPSRKPVVQKAVLKAPEKSFANPGKFIRPVSGKIISSYGPKKHGLHNDGVNIAAARGAAVKAAADGQVVYAGNGLKGYGNLILLKHGGRYLTAYGHLGELSVKKGDVIRAGQKIGTVGTSGQVKTPQLHFEIRKGTDALDPAKYI